MGKKIYIKESQLKYIVEYVNEEIEELTTIEKVIADFAREFPQCGLDENIVSEQDQAAWLMSKIKTTGIKGALAIALFVGLGLGVPTELRAQESSKPNNKAVMAIKSIFGDENKKQCKKIGIPKINKQKIARPTRYFSKTIQPKFDAGGEKTTYAFQFKNGEYVQLNKKDFEKLSEKGAKFEQMSSVRWQTAKTQNPDLR